MQRKPETTMDRRACRKICKDLGITEQDRNEIKRILQEDDYTAPFPLSAPVTYAKVILLIQIVQDSNLRLDTAIPIATNLTDKESISVHYGNLKRSCQRWLSSGKDLHQPIEFLYKPTDDFIGPFCSQIGITKTWLTDAHQETLDPGKTVCNGVILELYEYLKKCDLSRCFDTARTWMSLLHTNCTIPPRQTIQSDWIRLKETARSKGKVSKAKKDEFLKLQYQLPSVESTDVTSDCDQYDSSSNNDDIYHRNYNSPTKKLLVEHIQTQDNTISAQENSLSELHDTLAKYEQDLLDLKCSYDTLLEDNNGIVKDRNLLQHEMALLQSREEKMDMTIKLLCKEYNPQRVKKQLSYRENKVLELEGSVEEFKEELLRERVRVEKFKQDLIIEKEKKRKHQKRASFYKSKAKPLEKLEDNKIRELLARNKELTYENDYLQSQLEECLEDHVVKTFEDGRFVDGVRLVCYDFISRNVATENVAPLIRSVIEKLTPMGVGRLPKPTLVKLMALEADVLAKKHAATELLKNQNVTLHTDATTKHDRHYYSYQITTDTGSYSLDMQETVGGDTQTQIETTKTLIKELADLISPEDIDKGERPTEYKLLFNIKNTMTDRGPTSRGWVEGLEFWRDDILQNKVIPHLQELSFISKQKLSQINDFYCGKHFILGLAERAKIGLSLWEEQVRSFTGPIGREDLPEFKTWGCQKPSGYRLVRTACELFGPGAKPPHGMPTIFNDFLKHETNYLPQFQHNRFNIVFRACSGVFHHRQLIHDILTTNGSENMLHKSVLADLGSEVSIAEVRAMGLIEKHITTPLAIITSKKYHILDMTKQYKRLQIFLSEMAESAEPIMNGTALLFEDCPPIKDAVWTSLYESQSVEEDALTHQIIGVLCASFCVALERQLFDFLGGKWSTASETDDKRNETTSVPRNNDISERDFSGLDRLLRIKTSARLDFIRGIILYTNNRTGEVLQKMSEEDLHKELNSAITLARKSLQTYKTKHETLKTQRMEALEGKKRKKESQELKRVKNTQKAIDNIAIDGQQRSEEDVQIMLAKYATTKGKRDALKRQLDYYKTLKISSIPHHKFHMTFQKKLQSVDTLTENLLFIIHMWAKCTSTGSEPGEKSNAREKLTMVGIVDQEDRIGNLKRKLVTEAEGERLKKAKRNKETNMLPDSEKDNHNTINTMSE